jgi:hypothetical protein
MDENLDQAERDLVGGEPGSEPFQHLRELYERVSQQLGSGAPQPERPAGA